jgi:hypothetical protein
MELVDQTIWRELERKALAKIDTGQASSLPNSTRLLQFQILPSFSNPHSWSVYRHDSGYVATRIMWHRKGSPPAPEALMFDAVAKLRFRYKGIESVEPTLSTIQMPLEESRVDALLERLNGLRLPLMPKESMGLDGTTYELRLGDFYTAATLRWWSDTPTEWHALHEWARALFELLSADYDG